MSKRTFIVFGLLVVVLAVVIPWLIFNSKGDAQTGDQRSPSNLKGGPVAVPDQLRHLPHALRGRHRRQLRPEPRRTAGAERVADRRREDDQSDRRPRPQRGRKRRRRQQHPGPHAGRHPQRRADRRKSPNSSPTRPARADPLSAGTRARFGPYRGANASVDGSTPPSASCRRASDAIHNRLGRGGGKPRRNRDLIAPNRTEPPDRHRAARGRRRCLPRAFAGVAQAKPAKPSRRARRST